MMESSQTVGLQIKHFDYSVLLQWENSCMKRSGMRIGKYELNPKRRPIWARLKLYLTPKRCHLKWNRPNYQPLFRKGARSSRAIWKCSILVHISLTTLAFLMSPSPFEFPMTILGVGINIILNSDVTIFFL